MAVRSRFRAVRPPTSWSEALFAGVVASAIYPLVAIGFALAVGQGLSFSGSFLSGYLISVGFTLGTVGVPVVLWLRFGYRGPIALMSLVLVLLTFVAPLVAPRRGDAPAFVLVIYWAPFYLVLYALVGGVEHLYRRWRTRSTS